MAKRPWPCLQQSRNLGPAFNTALHVFNLQYTPCDGDSDCRVGSFCNAKGGLTYCQRCHDCTGRYRDGLKYCSRVP